MIIREFLPGDYNDLIDLWEKSGLPYRGKGRDSRINIEHQIKKGNTKFLLAFEDEKLIGSVFISDDARKGWINRLAVIPEYRSRGIGSLLIKEAEKCFAAGGIEIYCCLIEDWNKSSIELFQKHDYICHPDIFYLTKRMNPEV